MRRIKTSLPYITVAWRIRGCNACNACTHAAASETPHQACPALAPACAPNAHAHGHKCTHAQANKHKHSCHSTCHSTSTLGIALGKAYRHAASHAASHSPRAPRTHLATSTHTQGHQGKDTRKRHTGAHSKRKRGSSKRRARGSGPVWQPAVLESQTLAG